MILNCSAAAGKWPSANLGNVLLQLGQISAALQRYEQALQITPDDTHVRQTMGLVLMIQTGRLPEAVEQYEEAVRINPRYSDAHVALPFSASSRR